MCDRESMAAALSRTSHLQQLPIRLESVADWHRFGWSILFHNRIFHQRPIVESVCAFVAKSRAAIAGFRNTLKTNEINPHNQKGRKLYIEYNKCVKAGKMRRANGDLV